VHCNELEGRGVGVQGDEFESGVNHGGRGTDCETIVISDCGERKVGVESA
jgi:hypothetical protein